MARAMAMARRRDFGHKGRPGCLAAHLAQTMEAAGGELRASLDHLHRRLHALGFAVEEQLAPLADDVVERPLADVVFERPVAEKNM